MWQKDIDEEADNLNKIHRSFWWIRKLVSDSMPATNLEPDTDDEPPELDFDGVIAICEAGFKVYRQAFDETALLRLKLADENLRAEYWKRQASARLDELKIDLEERIKERK